MSIGYYSRPNSRSSGHRANELKSYFSETRSPLLCDRHVIQEIELCIVDKTDFSTVSESSSDDHSKVKSAPLERSDTNGNEGKLGLQVEFESGRSIINYQSFSIDDYDILSSNDIENKMAETKVKMNDASLSNGREELAIHNRKMKHYIKQREHLTEGANVAASMKQVSAFLPTNNNNNLVPVRPQTLSSSYNRKLAQNSQNQYSRTSNPFTGNADINIMDAFPIKDDYENEGHDVPEKIVRDMEKKLTEISDEEQASECEKSTNSGDVEMPALESGFILCASNNLDANKENTIPERKQLSSKSANS